MSRLDELIAELCPDGVEYKKLGEVATYANIRIPVSMVNCNTYVGVENLLPNKQGKTISNSVPKEGVVIQFNTGDILIGNIRPYLRKIWLADCDGGTNGDVLAIQIRRKTEIIPSYLYYVLSSEDFFVYDVQYSKGAKMPRGSKDTVMNYRLPVPPLLVQQEIVRILDHFTELQKQLDAELTARKKQYEYYRDKLFESLDNSVTVYNMGDVLTFINGRAYKQQELLDAGKYPVLRVGNFYTNNSWYYSDLELSEDKYCDNGDLLYSWAATLGPKIWNGRKCIFHYHIWKIIFDETIIDKNYLYYYLQYDLSEIAKSTTQSTMVHVSMDSMKKRRLRIPPINVQRRMAARIKEFDSLLSSVSSGLPAEIAARQKQYEYYRDKLLAFKRISI